MTEFIQASPTLDNYWRSIILFGRNVASYKFALGKSLLELRHTEGDLIRLEKLAEPFSRHLCKHIATNPKQATSASSRFLDACKSFNSGNLSKDQLVEATVRLGFNNVIDAFHVVNQGELPVRFFIDERLQHAAIRLTDDFYRLIEPPQSMSLGEEVEARWRLVETAWQLNVATNLIAIEHDSTNDFLFARDQQRRISVTSSRPALNGYQKGKCFYCFDEIGISDQHPLLADVDHFFPHVLKQFGSHIPVNGIWNLVLACRDCNRGQNGKSARLPSLKLLERLNIRNEFLISSHHPLRETLIRQTGTTAAMRRAFLQKAYDAATAILVHMWEPPPKSEAPF